MEESQKSIFSKRTGVGGGCGRRCSSLFPALEEKKTSGFTTGNGRFNIREIAEQVKTHGSVQFEFDETDMDSVRPPRPFQRRFGRADTDCYDIRDPNSPQEKSTDNPSADFHSCVQLVTGYPVTPDALDLVTKDGGVRKRVLKEANATLDKVTDGCRVWIHYETYRDNGIGKPLILLDSTVDHEMAASFQVGSEGMPGLQFGVKTMRVEEIAEFSISPVYAYGENGVIGFIPKNQHLRVVVELREVKHNHRKPMAFMTQAEKQTAEITVDDLVEEVDGLLEAGNAKFEKGLYRDACDRYNWALDLLQDEQHATSANWIMHNKSGSKIAVLVDHKSFQTYSNLALCLIRLRENEEAEKACQSALQLAHQRKDLQPKVFYRLAYAMFKQGKLKGAKSTCARALATTSWGHAEFRDLTYKVDSALERWEAREKLEGSQRGVKAGADAKRIPSEAKGEDSEVEE